jgi:hypothetical protein
MLRLKGYFVVSPRVSHDGAWISFLAGTAAGGMREAQQFATRLDVSLEVPAIKEDVSDWIPLGAKGRSFYGTWSSRGDSVYALDTIKPRIVAIPLNEKTKYPTGLPISLHELPAGQQQTLMHLNSSDGLVVAAIATSRRNIWMGCRTSFWR